MTAEKLYEDLYDMAVKFGMVPQNKDKEPLNPNGNAIVRKNLNVYKKNKSKNDKPFFGFINKDEETNGSYSDFSFIVFPDDINNVKVCVVGLVVGSNGFKNDYEAATLPGLRRMFLRLKDEKTYFKTSFDDIETTSSALLKEIKGKKKYSKLLPAISYYKKFLTATRIVDFVDGNTEMNILYSWLATYAEFREWAKNEDIETVLHKSPHKTKKEREKKEQEEIKEANEKKLDNIEKLLKARHYVVLQGAPGTGKTYTANKIAKKFNYTSCFIQFHAETTYSDFVYGLAPNTNEENGGQQFVDKPGILYVAIKYAISHPKENILLIIDEINRANLSNVLGPVFYLFEYQSGERTNEITIGDLSLTKLPNNFYVLATMNTADRSIAVVDFALRRRFAWYTMRPHAINTDPSHTFMSEYFKKFEDIFFKYASDEELNLQPGQSYFIVKKDSKEKEKEQMKKRLIYELMPLIKEYIEEGYLLKAKDEFSDLFLKETDKLMYE